MTMNTHYSILVIDDNVDDYELCHRLLSYHDSHTNEAISFQLRHAKSGQQGLDKINDKTPHCILLDYSLPGSDGLAVLQQIRKDEPYLPVIALTGQGNEQLAVSLLKAGAQDYLVKSEIHNHDLKKIVLKAIDAAQTNHQQKDKDTSQLNVLVIDDNIDDRELIIRTLNKTSSSYHFIEASSGSKALNLIEQHEVTCVLLDYSLPGENGLSVLKTISDNFPFVPVILFSGQGNENIAAQAIKNGAFHYLVKSEFTPELLDSTIRQALEKKHLEQVVYEKNQEVKRHQYDAVERKNRFDRVVQATNIVVWEYVVATDQLFVEEQIEILLGEKLNTPDLTLKQLHKRVHPDDLSFLTSHWQTHLQGASNELDITYRLRHKNGTWRWVRATGKTVATNTEGDASQVAGLFEDISEKKYEEEILNRLYTITVDNDLSLDQKISGLLYLGLVYFGLELGMVSRIDGENYKVMHCAPTGKITRGQTFSYSQTYCSHVFGTNQVRAWHHAGHSDICTHPCYRNQMLETYIGTTLFVNQKPYGTLAFMQKTARQHSFSDREETLLRLMGQSISSEITRQKNLSDIEESKSFLQLVQDSIPDMIFVKDEQFRIIRANPAFLEAYPESARSSVIGSTTIESFSKEEAAAFVIQDKIALQKGYSETEETIQCPDGTKRTLHTKKIRFQDRDNKPFILGVSHDITAVKQAEADQKELHEAMRNTVEGISQIDPQGSYVYVNDAYANTCGYQPHELLGKSWTITVDSDEHNTMNNAYQHMLATGKVVEETRGIRKNGSRFYKRVTMISRYNDEGQFIGHHCFMNDISERREAEARLVESEERYELAVKGSAVGLWDWNVKTGELFWSDRFKEIIGISKEDFRPSYEEFTERLHPEDKEKTEKALFSHIENRTPYDVEYRLNKTDNTYVWIHARGQAIWDEQGNATRMAGSVDDISESKLAQEELLRSNAELERFAYVASHDLQEPLRMVTNFTQLLEKRYGDKLDARALEFIQYASNGATRMQHLVRDLLEYARIGNEAENFEVIDLNSLRQTIEENLLTSIEQTGTIIEWAILPTILADPSRIRSVFQNLIGNAIKYRKPDEAPQIAISVESSSDQWILSIKDNGIGMKQQYCEKIFEPFKRLHRKEEYPGTGMGLAICRKTLEGLGGKIWVLSELGQGSTFYLSLPKIKH